MDPQVVQKIHATLSRVSGISLGKDQIDTDWTNKDGDATEEVWLVKAIKAIDAKVNAIATPTATVSHEALVAALLDPRVVAANATAMADEEHRRMKE